MAYAIRIRIPTIKQNYIMKDKNRQGESPWIAYVEIQLDELGPTIKSALGKALLSRISVILPDLKNAGLQKKFGADHLRSPLGQDDWLPVLPVLPG